MNCAAITWSQPPGSDCTFENRGKRSCAYVVAS